MKSKGPSVPVAPYRTGDVTQQLRARYTGALDEAGRAVRYRERIINIFMFSPAVIGISQLLKEDVSLVGAFVLMMIMNAGPILVRAKMVDDELALLRKIREKANRVSVDRHDRVKSIRDENQEIVNGVISNRDDEAFFGPYMITGCTAGIYWFLSLPMQRANSSLIFFWGLLATLVVSYHAGKLGKAQDAVRAELGKLLPHVEPEKKFDTNGGATHTQPLVVPLSLDKQDADTTVQDCRTGVRFNADPESSELDYASVEAVAGKKAAG